MLLLNAQNKVLLEQVARDGIIISFWLEIKRNSKLSDFYINVTVL